MATRSSIRGTVSLTLVIALLSFIGNAVQGVVNFRYARYQQRREELDRIEKSVSDRKIQYDQELEKRKTQSQKMIESLKNAQEVKANREKMDEDRKACIEAIIGREKQYADAYGGYQPSTREQLERSLGLPFDRWLRNELGEHFVQLRNSRNYDAYPDFFAFVKEVDPAWVRVRVASQVHSVNVRQEPDVNSLPVVQPLSGQDLEVVSIDRTGTWYKLRDVRTLGVGWASNNNLELPASYILR